MSLTNLQKSSKQFIAAWTAEINETERLVGDAAVAVWVKKRVDELSSGSNGFTSAQRASQFKEFGLIRLSEEIEAARDEARQIVANVSTIRIKSGEDADAVLDRLNKAKVKALRERVQMNKLLMSGATEEDKAALRRANEETTASADALEKGGSVTVMRPFLTSLLELRRMKSEIKSGIKDLNHLVSTLQVTHAAVDDVIQTDVRPDGAAWGKLIEKHQAVLMPAPEEDEDGDETDAADADDSSGGSR